MKVAVLGTGFGVNHARMYLAQPEVDQVIVWGRNVEKLEEVKKQLEVEVTNNMEDIWNDSRIDLVDICLPDHLHKEMAIKALNSGKNVYIEIPIAESNEDAKEIVEAAKRNHKKAFVDLFMRFEYAYQYVYEVKEKKDLGELKALYVKRDTPPWWGDLGLQGIVCGLMNHDIDFVRRMLGNPIKIQASSTVVRDRESIVSVLLNYPNAYARLESSSAMPGAHPFTIGYEAIFEKGTVRFYEDGYEEHRLDTKLSVFTDKDRIVVPLPGTDCFLEGIKHVVQCCVNDVSSINSAEEAADSLELVLRISEVVGK